MDLLTGKAITWHKVTPIPVMKTVIDLVEKMAKKQGIKMLKFTNQCCDVILDPDANLVCRM